MEPSNLDKVEFDDLIGCVIDYDDGKVGIISGLATSDNRIVGVMVQEAAEIDPLQSDVCPECKAIDKLEKDLKLNTDSFTAAESPKKSVQNMQINVPRPLGLFIHTGLQGVTGYQIMNPTLQNEQAIKVAQYFKSFISEFAKT